MATTKGKKTRKGRRARGTGSIFFDEARNRWIGRKPVGRTPTGKTLYLERWGKTQAEVVKKLAEASPLGPDTTLSVVADRWLASLGDRKPATVLSYAKSAAHVKEHLGDVRLRDLTPGRVEEFGTALAAGGLAGNTVRKVLAELRGMLAGSVRDEVIRRNPAAVARRPKYTPKKIDPFPPADLARVVADASQSVVTAPVALLAACGCRLGEALGLDVGDWDRAAGKITIRQTFDSAVGLGTPKSARSARTIRVPAAARAALDLAAADRTAGPLFTSGAGNRRNRDLLRESWGRIVKRLGLRYRNPHQLRHSVATAMIGGGVPLADVAAYLGDTVATVVQTYIHPTGVDPSVSMDAVLGGHKVEKD